MQGRVKKIISVLVVSLFIGAVLIVSQRRQEAQIEYRKDLFAMDTLFSMKIYGLHGEEALAQCEERVQELENLLSVTKEKSDVWRINHSGSSAGTAKAGVSVSEDTCSLIEAAVEIAEKTEGALEITLYPLLREWGFTTGEYRIPKEDEIQKLLEKVDYKAVATDRIGGTIHVPENVEIDLGAVAKGYTGDCLAELLQNQGVKSAMLDLGGNIHVLGSRPDGSRWRVAVRNPLDPGRELGVLEVSDKCVITSGNYERCFIGEDGRRYGHILNPADGKPVDNGLASVTVVGESGVRCDGLSTALFVMGKDRAVEFYRKNRDFEMLLVTEEGRLYITGGLADDFECEEGWDTEVIS